MDNEELPTPLLQTLSAEDPQSWLTWTYPPSVAPPVGKIRTVPPPFTLPAEPPLQPPVSLRATSELEFEFPAVLAATASVLTTALACPKMRPKNNTWELRIRTWTKPSRLA